MNEPIGLVKKLAQIRRDIRHIEKRGHNTFHKYNFLRAEDIAGDVGDKLAENNIVLARDDGKVTITPADKGSLCTIECYYVFVDGDTGEKLRVWACGSGLDSGDKGPLKALTACLKYVLSQVLCLRVGDDPEAESSDATISDDDRPF